MSMFKKRLDPLPFIKKASTKVNMDDPKKWEEDVEEYLKQKFPSISHGFRPVQFKEKDGVTGSALGMVAWRRGKDTLSIPIIIDDFKLHEPDMAVMDNHVIPLDVDYLNNMMPKDIEAGINYETDPINDWDYVGGLFDVTEYDDKGNPYGIRMSAQSETRDKLASVLSKIKDQKCFSEKIAGYMKIATCVDEQKAPVECYFEEIRGIPYHYKGAALIEDMQGNDTIEHYIDASEEQVSTILKNIDNRKTAAQDNKQLHNITYNKLLEHDVITTSGTYYNSIMGKRGIRTANVIADVKNIKGDKTGWTLILAKEERNKLSGSNGYKYYPAMWQYGPKAYYYKTEKNAIFNEADEKYTLPSGCREVNESSVGKICIFYLPLSGITAPYEITRYQKFYLGSNREKIELLDIDDIGSGERFRLWLSQPVIKPTMVDMEKLNKSNYSIIDGGGRELLLMPYGLEMSYLAGERQPIIIPETLRRMIEKRAAEANVETVITNTGNGYYDIDIKTNSGIRKLSEMDKTAALLYARKYINNNIESIDDVESGKKYASIMDIKANKVDLSPMDKYRGEWIKVAQEILSSVKLQKFVGNIKDKTQLGEKIAGIKEIADSLIRVDLSDSGNIKGEEEILPMVRDAIDKIGQLLLVTRLSKSDLSITILSRAFAAMTDLHNEIKGANTNNA
jgi:hypothetical protein